MGIRVPQILTIPNQTWAHCTFSSLCPMRGPWKKSPWGETLREGVVWRLSHRWASFRIHNQKSLGKTLSVGETPLDLAATSLGALELNRRPNTLSGVSREACLTKLKEKGGKKKPNLLFPLHLELQVTPKILAHGGYKVSHLSYSKTRAKPAHNWKHFFYMFMGKLSFSPSPSAAWN